MTRRIRGERTRDSDAGVPGVAAFRRRGAEAFAEAFERVGCGDMRNVLHTLVAELARDAEGASGPAEAEREDRRRSCLWSEGLGMRGIGHVDAFPPVRLDREVNEVASLR